MNNNQMGRQPEVAPPSLLRKLGESFEELAFAINKSRLTQGTHRLHSFSFEPFFQLGDTAHVYKSDGEIDILIEGVGAMPLHRENLGTATATSNSNDVTELDMPDGEIAQYRFSPVTNFTVAFTHPSSTTRQWKSDSATFVLPTWSEDATMPEALRNYYFAASEFWVYEQETPRFDVNLVANQQTRAYADFWGWRYKFRKINETG